METGSTTAWTAYSAAARITMPGTSMHQSQSQIQNRNEVRGPVGAQM